MTTKSCAKCTLLDVLTQWQAHDAVCKQLLVYKQAVCGVCARTLTRLKTAAQLCDMFSVCYVSLSNSRKHDAGNMSRLLFAQAVTTVYSHKRTPLGLLSLPLALSSIELHPELTVLRHAESQEAM